MHHLLSCKPTGRFPYNWFCRWGAKDSGAFSWVFYAVVSKNHLIIVVNFLRMRRAYHIAVSCIEIEGRYIAQSARAFCTPATKSVVWKLTFIGTRIILWFQPGNKT